MQQTQPAENQQSELKSKIRALEVDDALKTIRDSYQILQTKSQDVSTLLKLGEAYEKLGALKASEVYFHQAIAIQPKHLSAWLSLFNLLRQQERYTEAIDVLQNAVNILPHFFQLYQALSQAYEKVERLDEAVEAMTQAVQLQPNNVHLLAQLGAIRFKQQRYTDAVSSYQQALDLQPGFALALSLMAQSYAQMREFSLEINCLSQLTQRFPNNEGYCKRLEKAKTNLKRQSEVGLFLIPSDFGSEDQEKSRLRSMVESLQEQGKPVYLQFGFGPRPFDNFLNIDVAYSQRFPFSYDKMFSRIFIFPWLDAPLPLPDNSVDFIFHQDMFEHLSQRQQFLLLAETLRVLKPNCYHRINAPCLADSMRSHSSFTQGFTGVYQDEWLKWHHVNLITKNMLQEMAEIVGYRKTLFNAKNASASGIDFVEVRPGLDRDQVTGNVFADLMK
jgi:tetratricopeptide (TPR) repeat protein